MTRLNVYLPDTLATEAKEAGLDLSAVAQEAGKRTLAARATQTWSSAVLSPEIATGVTHEQALAALDDARDDTPTRHG